jgi:RNA polymerase sigma factor for flagellar operon FliA
MLAKNPTERNEILQQHFGLVHHVARKMQKHLSTEASLDDLVSAGSVGLLSAADNFDPARGLAFSTFALPRIRGAILDDLRKQDRVPRSVRRKARALQHAREVVTQRTGHLPADRDVATELGVDVETVWAWDADLAAAQVVPLDPGPREGDDRVSGPQYPSDAERADDRLERQSAMDLLRQALHALPARDRQVLALYYYEELTQQQIAQVLGVTESRVSQIRAGAVKRLRVALHDKQDAVSMN